MGSTKSFKCGVIRCPTEGVIGRKPQSGNFRQIFPGPRGQKLLVRSEKLGTQKCDGHPYMRMQNSVEIGRRTAIEDEKQCCFLFVCLYVCHAGVQERGPDVQQRIMPPFHRAISMRFSVFFTERNELSKRLQRFQLYY